MTAGADAEPLAGAALIRSLLPTLTLEPGVYRMLAADGSVLYVGKAKSLRRRVASYARTIDLPERTRRMVAQTRAMEFVVTRTEAEALLLEANLIKRLRPRFNILLREGRAAIHLALTDHAFPRAEVRHGRGRGGELFGPYLSAGAAAEAARLIERAFQLRSCSDAEFAHRTRPCLKHQLKRCTAPCVGRVAASDYALQVGQARAFLRGRSHALQEGLAGEMEAAAAALDFERAAGLRDRIRLLAGFSARQDINFLRIADADAVAVAVEQGRAAMCVLSCRAGASAGHAVHFPSHEPEETAPAILAAFLLQHYADGAPPAEIVVSHPLDETDLVEEALAIGAGAAVRIVCPKKGERKRLLELATRNAEEALRRRLAERASQEAHLDAVARLFALPGTPSRIEVYDNSHIQGDSAIGALIVATPEGFEKKSYRKFDIRTPGAAGDDVAMMREVFSRRFRLGPGSPDLPDLVLVDGGATQLEAARTILAGLGLPGLPLVGIAKGPDRNAGREQFFRAGAQPFRLPENDPTLFFLQRLRDEAHRFAIGTHRAKRGKRALASALDGIPGIGAARKRALLRRFGSVQGVREASLEEIASVPGLGPELARAVSAALSA